MVTRERTNCYNPGFVCSAECDSMVSRLGGVREKHTVVDKRFKSNEKRLSFNNQFWPKRRAFAFARHHIFSTLFPFVLWKSDDYYKYLSCRIQNNSTFHKLKLSGGYTLLTLLCVLCKQWYHTPTHLFYRSPAVFGYLTKIMLMSTSPIHITTTSFEISLLRSFFISKHACLIHRSVTAGVRNLQPLHVLQSIESLDTTFFCVRMKLG